MTFLKKMQETIGDIFIVYYKSPKKRQEIKSLSTLLDETFKQFGSLKYVRWVQSRYHALGIINHNYTALVKHQQEIAASNDKNDAKAKGHVLQLKSLRFLYYLQFSMDFVETIRQTSLFFQKDDLLVCCVLRIINERISVLKALKVQNGKNMCQFLLNLTEDEDGNISFKNIVLNKEAGRRHVSLDAQLHSLDYYNEFYKLRFEGILREAQKYLKGRFSDFEENPLKAFTIFDFKVWPSTFTEEDAAFGFKEMEVLSHFYSEHGYISNDEASGMLEEWSLLKSRVSTHRKSELVVVYCDLLKEACAELKTILVMVEIMLTISSSTASCERGFSTMNREKTAFAHVSKTTHFKIYRGYQLMTHL